MASGSILLAMTSWYSPNSSGKRTLNDTTTVKPSADTSEWKTVRASLVWMKTIVYVNALPV